MTGQHALLSIAEQVWAGIGVREEGGRHLAPIPRSTFHGAVVDTAAIRRHQKTLASKDLAREWHLLGRMIYKNTNQHAGSLHWRKLRAVQRLWRRWEGLGVSAVLERLLQLMHPSSTKRKQSTWECMPALPELVRCMGHLASAYLLAYQTINAYEECFLAFQSIAKQTYFMPLALVVMGCVSRCRAWTHVAQSSLASAYSLINQWRRLTLDCIMPVLKRNESWDKGIPSYYALLPEYLSMEEADGNVPRIVPSPAHDTSSSSDEEDEGTNNLSLVESEVISPNLNFFGQSTTASVPPVEPTTLKEKKNRKGLATLHEIDDIFGDC